MIKIDLTSKIPEEFQLTESELNHLIFESLNKLGVSKSLLIEMSFVDAEEIQALNHSFRDIDKPTDVLSFPQKPIGSSELELLGSIIICAKMVNEKQENIGDVIKHGLLHLLGYDHETDETEWDRAAKVIRCKL